MTAFLRCGLIAPYVVSLSSFDLEHQESKISACIQLTCFVSYCFTFWWNLLDLSIFPPFPEFRDDLIKFFLNYIENAMVQAPENIFPKD